MRFEILTEENIWNYADGIDFCVIFSNKITHSYTKEEFKDVNAYPKNNRRYWIIRDGIKAYLQIGKEICKSDDGKIYQEV